MCTASVCAVKHMQMYNKLIEVGCFLQFCYMVLVEDCLWIRKNR